MHQRVSICDENEGLGTISHHRVYRLELARAFFPLKCRVAGLEFDSVWQDICVGT